jgi:hypothetical protein
MTPWVIRSPSQFRPAGPPPPASARYAADFNEVKALGSIGSQLRTPDQTLLVQFWQSTTPSYIFNHAALALAADRHETFSEQARLLSLLNTGMADADIACWDAKYHYVFWRPVGDRDSAGGYRWQPADDIGCRMDTAVDHAKHPGLSFRSHIVERRRGNRACNVLW